MVGQLISRHANVEVKGQISGAGSLLLPCLHKFQDQIQVASSSQQTPLPAEPLLRPTIAAQAHHSGTCS